MQITSVTVHYQETRSLPGYSNVQPSVGLTVQLAAGEDAQATVNALLAECRATVRAEIDAALVANGCRPHYARTEFGERTLGFDCVCGDFHESGCPHYIENDEDDEDEAEQAEIDELAADGESLMNNAHQRAVIRPQPISE